MQTIRVLTLNLWGEQPPLERRLPLVIEGLRALTPDVIALQEVRQITDKVPNTAETIAAALGMSCHFEIATPWGGGEEGLALLSRFPIGERMMRELPHATPEERRIVVGATFDTPAGAFSAFTTHLTYRLADGQKREDQVVAAEALVAATRSELPKVLMGDLNATPDADEIRWLAGLRSVTGQRVFYQDAWRAIHGDAPGITWSRANTHAHKLAWLTLDRRIDYIFVTAQRRDGRGVVRDCRVVLDTPDAEGCFPSDHFAVMADIAVKGE
jgi:endonuclease/exonuclease/phosphatase family metal-dependent hydrolase